MPDDAISILKKDMREAYHRYYGFEIKPFHFRLIGYSIETYMKHLDQLGYTHFIILDRKNRLRKITPSNIAHNEKTRYHITQDKKLKVKQVHINTEKVEIDFDSKPLLDYLTDFDTQFDEIRKLMTGRNILELTYEDHIMNDPKVAYGEVCDFLGIKQKKVDVSLSRTNPFPLREMIENDGEVEQVLKGTPYAWMLDD